MTKVLLLVLFGLFICNDCSSDGIEKIKKLGRYCTDEYGEPGWQCNDNGMCLRLEWVCDGFNQCDEDDEDEKEGCNLFPDSNCKSWNGQRHVRCHQNNSICTLPTYSNSDCRRCEKSDKWRCDDGQCINKNWGQKCKDGSDENSNNDTDDDSDNDESSTKKPDTNEEFLKSVFTRYIFKWWTLLLMVMVMCSSGVFASYLVRVIWQRTNLFHCRECEPLVKPLSFQRKKNQGQDGDEVDPLLRKDQKSRDQKFKSEVRDEAYGLPMNLINILENPNNWSKRNLHGKHEKDGRYYYAKVHQNPVEYQNFYQYLVFRYASANRLNRVIEKLYQWELEIHNSDAEEVLKCWRLHLGSCDVFKQVLAAHHYDAKSTYQVILKKWYLPLKTKWTKWRKPKNPTCLQRLFNLFARLYNIFFFAIRPFMGASALYLDIFKNWILVYLFWSSLDSLMKKDFETTFEPTLRVVMISAIGLAQLSIMTLSFLSAPKLLLCEHNEKKNPSRAFMIRLACTLIGPIFPVIIFANYISHREHQHRNERKLQCHGSLEYDWGNDLEMEAKYMEKEAERDPNEDAKKVALFRKILKFRYAASLHKRYYSFFRVVQATMESIVVLITLLLILVIRPVPERTERQCRIAPKQIDRNSCAPKQIDRDFWSIVSEKITDFVGFDFGEMMEFLNLDRHLAIWCVLSYNVLMIITAITRYVYQNKTKNMTLKGQTCYGLFIIMHLTLQVTNPIALLSTSGNGNSLLTFKEAFFLWFVICIFHLVAIYLFKYLTIPEFKKEPIEHQIVHVLANTIVVIPFKTWDHAEPQQNLAMTKKQIEVEVEGTVRRQSMIPKKQSKLHSIDNLSVEQDESKIQIEEEDQVQQFKTEDIRDILIQIWWKDPSRKLTADNAKAELDIWISSTKTKLGLSGDTDIGKIVESLNDKGFINKKLYHPRCTKLEYFWLFFIQVIINVTTFIIEIANGGEEITHGTQYYTWDVRGGTFVMGLVFLGMYYKDHHMMKDIIKFRFTSVGLRYCPIFFCFKREKPIQAIPNRVKLEEILSNSAIHL